MKRYAESLWDDDSGQVDGDWDRHQPGVTEPNWRYEAVSPKVARWWLARCRRTLRRSGGGAAGVTN